MVADDASERPGRFDVQTIKLLVGLMSRHDLAEIDLREGDLRIRLRRGARGKSVPPPMFVPAPAVMPTPAPSASTPPTPAPTPASAVNPSRAQHVILAPTPGTFYTSPSPGAEAFVRVGSRVTPASVVGLLEAMKLFNEITAECNGVISEILVENQQPVEFNQPLFKVDLAG